jgi:hypothetical protein
MKIAILNKSNNMGDAMCQLRGVKEYKDQHPDVTLDFVTCHYLHYLMATHTDLFESVRFLSPEEIATFAGPYAQTIEFTVDWAAACDHGILKAWTEKTLGFTPSTDKPYFQATEEEQVIARAHAGVFRSRYRKLVLAQLNAPSDGKRSFDPADWDRVLDLIPPDVGIIYPGPVELAIEHPFRPRPNLLLLPGYHIGVTAALLPLVDLVLGVHGGTIMLAHAMDMKRVIHVMFTEAGSPNLLSVPEWDNLVYPSRHETNWEQLADCITRRLT